MGWGKQINPLHSATNSHLQPADYSLAYLHLAESLDLRHSELILFPQEADLGLSGLYLALQLSLALNSSSFSP